MLADTQRPIMSALAREVLEVNGITEDGLTSDMQAMLTFLYTRCKQTTQTETRHQASVSTIASAIGKSRDTKAINLRVEPPLIHPRAAAVTHGGRRLSDDGIQRAVELIAAA